MCEPVTITTALAIAAAGYSAKAQYEQGKYQSKVSKNNAIIKNQLAADAISRGRVAEDNKRMQVAQAKSMQRAKFGASGVDVNMGSASDIQADTAMIGELDALTIRNNAEREAYGFRVGASNAEAQSIMDKKKGKSDAIGTILSGGKQAAGQWYQMSNKGET